MNAWRTFVSAFCSTSSSRGAVQLALSFVIGASALGFSSVASADHGYAVFNRLSALEGRELKEELAKTLRETHSNALDYRAARVAVLGRLYLEADGNEYRVRCVYCQKDFSSKNIDGIGPNQVPSDRVMNVEHTWPQSKFEGGEKGAMKSDLHHLFPSDSQINSQRGNIRFGEVQGNEQNIKCSTSHLGNGPDGRPQFEPPVVHKGNVARALFYFSIRYKAQIDPVQEKYLREWHREDPADEMEQARNNQIEELQGNRNPFIDRPEWVDRISDF